MPLLICYMECLMTSSMSLSTWGIPWPAIFRKRENEMNFFLVCRRRKECNQTRNVNVNVPLMDPEESKKLCFPWAREKPRCQSLDFALSRPVNQRITRLGQFLSVSRQGMDQRIVLLAVYTLNASSSVRSSPTYMGSTSSLPLNPAISFIRPYELIWILNLLMHIWYNLYLTKWFE